MPVTLPIATLDRLVLSMIDDWRLRATPWLDVFQRWEKDPASELRTLQAERQAELRALQEEHPNVVVREPGPEEEPQSEFLQETNTLHRWYLRHYLAEEEEQSSALWMVHKVVRYFSLHRRRCLADGKPRQLMYSGPEIYAIFDEAFAFLAGLQEKILSRRPDWQSSTPKADGEDPEVPDPEDKLVRRLTGLNRDLLLYLWKRGNVSQEELRQAVWNGKPVSDKAIENAVDRLNLRLINLGQTHTQVEKGGGLYYLEHVQK